MVALTIKRSELLLFDDRTNETGLELPAVSHFLAMYGLCSYSGLYIKILLLSAIVRTAGCESVFSKYFLSLTLRECPPRQQKGARSGSQDKILIVLSHYYHNIKTSNQTDILRVGCYSSEKRTGLLPRAITMILRCIVAASVLLLAHGLSFPFGRSRRRILLDVTTSACSCCCCCCLLWAESAHAARGAAELDLEYYCLLARFGGRQP